jgi:hypothetical protein
MNSQAEPHPTRWPSLMFAMLSGSPQIPHKSGSGASAPTRNPRTKRHYPAFGSTADMISVSAPDRHLPRSDGWQLREILSVSVTLDPLVSGRSAVRFRSPAPEDYKQKRRLTCMNAGGVVSSAFRLVTAESGFWRLSVPNTCRRLRGPVLGPRLVCVLDLAPGDRCAAAQRYTSAPIRTPAGINQMGPPGAS